MAEEKLQITLAVSLHASSQEKRKKLMPVANAYGIHELIRACRYYFEKTGRRITFEYSLVAGVNDQAQDAEELAALIGGLPLPCESDPGPTLSKSGILPSPTAKAVQDFQKRLEKYRINVTIRREMGRDIDGACGQLRKRFAERQDA